MSTYFKILLFKIRSFLMALLPVLIRVSIYIVIFVVVILDEGYSLGDFDINVYPFDYCYLTDVDYTAVLDDGSMTEASPWSKGADLSDYDLKQLRDFYNRRDDPKARVKITEYLTYDVHSAFKGNPFKELWRELPEDDVDGLKVTYDVVSVSQIMPDGSEVPYTHTTKMYWEDEDYTKNATKYWHHSMGSGRYPDNDESLLMYIPWTYRDKLKFKIEYYMNNAALKYNDCSELYLSMYSGSSITHLKSLKAQILIPDDMMPKTYYAYTYGTAKTRIPFDESASMNPGYYTFSIDLDKSDLKFNFHNRFVEFCLLAYGKYKDSLVPSAPDNDYSNQNVLEECIAENEYYTKRNSIYNMCKLSLLTISFLASWIIVIMTKRKYRKVKEQYTFYEPEVDYEYFRDIPSDLDPFFASELVFMKNPFTKNKEKGEEYAAILLSLVRKKYVKLTKLHEDKDWTATNTRIILEPLYSSYGYEFSPDGLPTLVTYNKDTSEALEPLATSERLYLNLLEKYITDSNCIVTLDFFQSRVNIDVFNREAFVVDMAREPMIENGVENGYFQQMDYDSLRKSFEKSSKTSFNLALFIMLIVNSISYFTPMGFAFGAYALISLTLIWRSLFFASKEPELVLFTQYGKDEQAKWYGLYNFLNSNTLINEKEVHELPLWEKYLIYATAFGVSEKVIKAIKLHISEINVDNSPILCHHSYIHSPNFHRTSISFGRSIHTSSRSSSFGGHGYGGGGRGGGGGGGGH